MGRKWDEIVKLPNWNTDEMLHRGFAYADRNMDELFTASMERAFPQCFHEDVDKLDSGPVPWSVLKLVSTDFGFCWNDAGEEQIEMEICEGFGLEFRLFAVKQEVVDQYQEGSVILLPESIFSPSPDCGVLIVVDNQNYIIARYDGESGAIPCLKAEDLNLVA
jgi:hypothetical protein